MCYGLQKLLKRKVKNTKDTWKKRSENYPQYGFSSNKGYGTKVHREALDKYGPCEIHRMSYKQVKASMSDEQFEKWKSRTK